MSYGPSVQEILADLKAKLGSDWHVKLAQEMSEEDYQDLQESMKAPRPAKKPDEE